MLLASLQLSVGALLPWSWEFVQSGVGMLVSFQRKAVLMNVTSVETKV